MSNTTSGTMLSASVLTLFDFFCCLYLWIYFHIWWIPPLPTYSIAHTTLIELKSFLSRGMLRVHNHSEQAVVLVVFRGIQLLTQFAACARASINLLHGHHQSIRSRFMRFQLYLKWRQENASNLATWNLHDPLPIATSRCWHEVLCCAYACISPKCS